ncbi:MAG: transcriptional repressor [Planctomycetota bacterium]|jgi:Fur family ferric uptake transcriptional regulator
MIEGPSSSDRRNECLQAEMKRLFEENGIIYGNNERAVVEDFLASDEHLCAAEISSRLALKEVKVSTAIAARVLNTLCEMGIAQEVRFRDGEKRYEHRHLGSNMHHDHAICMRCGKLVEFFEPSLEKFQSEIADKLDFRLLTHRMELYGICSSCLNDREPCMPLTQAMTGEKVKIVSFMGGDEIRKRLDSLHLAVGKELEVISKEGTLLVALGTTRVALGWGLAAKIMVVPL